MISDLKVRAPYWNYNGKRSVGISHYRTNHQGIKIDFLYKDKEGKKLYDNSFYISGQRARAYPKETRKGILLYIVPIDDLERWGR